MSPLFRAHSRSGFPCRLPARRACLALLVTIVIWAYSWVVMKQVLAWAGPFDFAALRYLLGAGVLFAALLLSGRSLRPPPLGPTLLIGLCQTAAFQGLEQWALLDGGAGHVALLAYTMPFWAVLLAWLLLGDRPTRAALARAGAGRASACCASSNRGAAMGSAAEHRAGDCRRTSPGPPAPCSASACSSAHAPVGAQPHGVADAGWAAARWALLALAVPQRPLEWNLGLHRRSRLQRGAGVQPRPGGCGRSCCSGCRPRWPACPASACPCVSVLLAWADPARAAIGDGAGRHRVRAAGVARDQRGRAPPLRSGGGFACRDCRRGRHRRRTRDAAGRGLTRAARPGPRCRRSAPGRRAGRRSAAAACSTAASTVALETSITCFSSDHSRRIAAMVSASLTVISLDAVRAQRVEVALADRARRPSQIVSGTTVVTRAPRASDCARVVGAHRFGTEQAQAPG